MRLNGVELARPALVVLGAATLATLSSGTNYVVGSYAPQLKERLHLSAAQINLVASCGNFGVYLTGPFFGYLADNRGPRALLFAGSLLLGIGYLGLFWAYQSGGGDSLISPSEAAETLVRIARRVLARDGVAADEIAPTGVHVGISTLGDVNALARPDPPMALLAAFSFCTGLGSALGNTAGLNAVARSFVSATRGLAMGIVVAGYGLSAFIYSLISGLIIGDNTAAFLLVLAFGTFASLGSAGFLLTSERMQGAAYSYDRLPDFSITEDENERVNLRSSTSSGAVSALARTSVEGPPHVHNQTDDDEESRAHDEPNAPQAGSSGTTGSLAPFAKSSHRPKSSIAIKQALDGKERFSGSFPTISSGGNAPSETGALGLFRVPDYYGLMLVMFCTTGTGLMWINSVGTAVVTLAEFNHTVGKIIRLQSHQTSLLSIFNCLGRLFIGAVSDQARTRLGLQPVWWLCLVCLSFILSQSLANGANDLESLTLATSLVGFAYGQLYGIMPIIMLDWFGVKCFSANVGTLYVVPTFSGYTFSHLFGSIYDSNMDKTRSQPAAARLASTASSIVSSVAALIRRAPTGDTDHSHVCTLGKACYSSVFSYTIPACTIALIASVVLGWRRGRNIDERADDAERIPGIRARLEDEEEYIAEVHGR